MASAQCSLFSSRHILSSGVAVRVFPNRRGFGGFGCFRVRARKSVVRSVLEVDSRTAEGIGAVAVRERGLGLDAAVESELREKGFMGLRKTKLVCTVGPACDSFEELERLALGGMNVARLNMCHNSMEWHRGVVRKIKRLNEEKGFCVSLMIDIEGAQMDVVDHGTGSSVKAERNRTALFGCLLPKNTKALVYLLCKQSPKGFLKVWKTVHVEEGIIVGDVVVIDGGMTSFEVIDKVGNDLRCKCIDPGLLLPRAKLSFWRDGKLVDKDLGLPILSRKDWADIEFGFLKELISLQYRSVIRVLAKIESLESLKNLEEIVEASDGIMVARGDLGVQIPLEQIPAVQEDITRLCRQLNKPVIVASQLLESMVEYPTPTRAEVADVSEAVRQYADALMLSGESAIGLYGDKALSVLRMTSSHMELASRMENQQNLLVLPELGVSLPERIAEQICNSSVEIANNLGVDAIFVYTRHGDMASLLSRNRPNSPIFAFTDKNSTRKALNLQWGVIPLYVELSDDIDDNIMKTSDLLKAKGMLKGGDVVLVVSDIDSSFSEPSVFQSIKVDSQQSALALTTLSDEVAKAAF
ncbi:hypothetical protein Syun_004437 [Stephania yunnanensis]|uniref:Pyruvate kinase n=1 Tax=Stephania yunnanensis TaxID=152371 RepID=A0AAP0L3Z5_9MAGN